MDTIKHMHVLFAMAWCFREGKLLYFRVLFRSGNGRYECIGSCLEFWEVVGWRLIERRQLFFTFCFSVDATLGMGGVGWGIVGALLNKTHNTSTLQ